MSESMGARWVCPGAAVTRRDRRRVETRDRLYEAAMELFRVRDFESVTVEMITEAADLGKGTFFNYFASKESVVAYRFELQSEQLKAGLDALESGAAADAGTWDGMLCATRRIAERDGQSKRLLRTVLGLTLTNPVVRQAHTAVKDQVLAAVQAFVRHGQETGEIRADVAAQAITEFIVSIYFNTCYRWALADDDRSLGDMLVTAYGLIHDAFRGPNAVTEDSAGRHAQEGARS